jgi:hypothetical protein
MPVFPFDLHPSPRLELDFHGFGIGGGHGLQYRRRASLVVRPWSSAKPKSFTAENAEIAEKSFRLAFLRVLGDLGGKSLCRFSDSPKPSKSRKIYSFSVKHSTYPEQSWHKFAQSAAKGRNLETTSATPTT